MSKRHRKMLVPVAPVNTSNLDNRYRAFAVRFRGPTETKGATIHIWDLRHNRRKVIQKRDDLSTHSEDQAATYLESIGIHIVAMALMDFGPFAPLLLLSDDFATELW